MLWSNAKGYGLQFNVEYMYKGRKYGYGEQLATLEGRTNTLYSNVIGCRAKHERKFQFVLEIQKTQ